MNCTEIDLKAYYLGEAGPAGRPAVEAHLEACPACREELARLETVGTALRAFPEEELPRRIAFVSDRVFEPRWWEGWRRWAFVPASAMAAWLAVGLVPRPAPAPAVDMAAIERRIQTEVARRVEESEARQGRKLAELVAASEKRMQFDWRADLTVLEENVNVWRKQVSRMYLASSDAGGPR